MNFYSNLYIETNGFLASVIIHNYFFFVRENLFAFWSIAILVELKPQDQNLDL